MAGIGAQGDRYIEARVRSSYPGRMPNGCRRTAAYVDEDSEKGKFTAAELKDFGKSGKAAVAAELKQVLGIERPAIASVVSGGGLAGRPRRGSWVVTLLTLAMR